MFRAVGGPHDRCMTDTVGTKVPEIAVAALVLADDEFEQYERLRAAGPVAKAGLGQWAVTRHAEVAALLRDRRVGHAMPRSFLEFAFGDGASADFRERSLLNRDGPDHTRLRTLMGKAFSASLVRRMRDHVADLTDALLTPLLDRGRFDVVTDLALPLPVLVICELLGIADVDRDEVARNTSFLFSQDREKADTAIEWVRDYLGEVLADRRPDADGDLLQRMLAAEDGDDAWTHEEIVDNAALLFVAGFETTKHLIAGGAVALLRFPDQFARLRSDPSLASGAVEEVVRFDGPAANVAVVTLEPVEVGDMVIKAGRAVHLMLRCANRDERAFTEPGRLDIGRHPNRHVAFGGGVHHCLGAMLARVEGEVVFTKLATRVGSLEADGEWSRQPESLAYATVPVRATAS